MASGTDRAEARFEARSEVKFASVLMRDLKWWPSPGVQAWICAYVAEHDLAFVIEPNRGVAQGQAVALTAISSPGASGAKSDRRAYLLLTQRLICWVNWRARREAPTAT
jgi:hypothetical protein